MKKWIFPLLSIFALLPAGASAGSSYYGCQKKLFNLEKQLEYARHYNNINRVRGLERAISRVKTYCSPASASEPGLYDGYSGATYLRDYNDRLSLKKKILKAELELKEAEMKGDPLKIAKRKGKLNLLKEELQLSENFYQAEITPDN